MAVLQTLTSRVKRQVTPTYSWHNGWNESTATEHCENVFAASNIVQRVQTVPGVNVTDMMADCVADIKDSGTTLFTAMAVASLHFSALYESMVNPELSEVDPEKPSATTLFDEITLFTCQGDCSGRGECIKGGCQCETGYGGEDCSVDLRTPPEVLDVGDGGHCDLAAGDCTRVAVIGKVFSGDEDATCRIEKYTIHPTGFVEMSVVTSSAAVSESISEAECTIPESAAGDYVVIYNISVSQSSGQVYSNPLPVLLYDSSCVTVNHSTRVWSISDEYCLYKGKCAKVGDARKDEQCLKCATHPHKPDQTTWERSTGVICRSTSLQVGRLLTALAIVAAVALQY